MMIEALTAVIESVVGDAPGGEAPCGSLGYIGTVNFPGSDPVPGVAIGRPQREFWPSSMMVNPLPIGCGIVGFRINGNVVWEYIETPARRGCGNG